MRCPKCGRISFDYLENCLNCGHDLREISAGIGGFAKPDPELIWFSMDSKTDSVETEPESPLVEQEAGNSANISEAEKIDSSDLETVADDEVFQRSLDNVLKNE
ncbi:hypothetical protein ES703_33957 [subsurface metagenome]